MLVIDTVQYEYSTRTKRYRTGIRVLVVLVLVLMYGTRMDTTLQDLEEQKRTKYKINGTATRMDTRTVQ